MLHPQVDSAAQTACAVGDAETESSGDPQGCFKSSKEESDPGVSKPKSDKNKAARPLTTLDCEVCDRSLSSGRHTAAAKHDIETQTFGDVNMAVDTASASLVVPTCCKSSSEATRQAASSSSFVDSVEFISYSPGRETTSSLAHPPGRGKLSGDQMDDAEGSTAAAAQSGAIEPAPTSVRMLLLACASALCTSPSNSFPLSPTLSLSLSLSTPR